MGRPALGGPLPVGSRASGVWGRLALGFLAAVVATGVALSPAWSAEAPYASLHAIQHGLPWGWLLRGAHWAAAVGLFARRGRLVR